MNAHHIGRYGHDADGRKILDRIVGDFGKQAGVDDEARADHGQRVAIGRGRRDHAGSRVAAGARLVHDVELFAQLCRQFVANDAGNDIGGPTCGKPDYDFDGSVGIGLRSGGRGNERAKADQHQGEQSHGRSSKRSFKAFAAHGSIAGERGQQPPASGALAAASGRGKSLPRSARHRAPTAAAGWLSNRGEVAARLRP
jgi:hypothetical protein